MKCLFCSSPHLNTQVRCQPPSQSLSRTPIPSHLSCLCISLSSCNSVTSVFLPAVKTQCCYFILQLSNNTAQGFAQSRPSLSFWWSELIRNLIYHPYNTQVYPEHDCYLRNSWFQGKLTYCLINTCRQHKNMWVQPHPVTEKVTLTHTLTQNSRKYHRSEASASCKQRMVECPQLLDILYSITGNIPNNQSEI